MKPIFEKIYTQSNSSFKIKRLETSSFDYPYHYHPEYELTLIKKGSGHRFVGDHSGRFGDNDLVLVGKNLPHCWLDYGENDFNSSAMVVQFEENGFGKGFFNLPEMILVKSMLNKSVKGIHFINPPPKVIRELSRLMEKEGLSQMLSLLSILHELSFVEEYTILSGAEYGLKYESSRFRRLKMVFEYVSNNFKSDIKLPEVASLVHMTPSAFCHYFKKYTKKTFTQYINEVKIGYACKLLMETDLNVAEICYQSGYNSLSMFNKHFKKITKKTPLHYRRQFLYK